MADINIDLDSNDRTELLGQGIRAYMMRDYNAAVSALSRASEIGVKEHNDDKHDSLAEIYLFYGKALLELSREESEPLGDAIPRETEDSDDEEEVDQEDNEANGITESDKMDVCDSNESKPKDKSEISTDVAEKVSEETKSPNKTEPPKVEESEEDKEPSSTQSEASTTEVSSVKEREANPSKTEKSNADEAVTNGQADSTDDIQKTNGHSDLQENGTSGNKDEAQQNGVESEPCTSQENGEKVEETEDEPTDLQVAWEVLELAKIIYEKRGESSKKDLAETLITLGEVSMESENFDSAITDIKQGLEIQKTILDNNSRKLAETYYKLGMALSTNNQIEEAIENFNHSLKILNNKVDKLKESDGNSKVQTEIDEIKSLIPEIEEKIADMKCFKEEALKKLSITLEKQSGTKTDGSSSDTKANDISHLVKRKRKIEEITEELEANPSKRKTPEDKKSPEEVVSTVEEVKTSE
ncbi:histone-binding protein N1/N2-like [Agrilus planipennis]|uniref:Histone-binding protein N1/N2-like n=1 Tax=Agrilus planipennis TaxID=224129 RepID=A0A1W4XLY9_AGRPL|nr:histone-binding protein N1/N2-like [Agrilus planipennis]